MSKNIIIILALTIGFVGGYYWGSSKVIKSYAPKIAAVNKLFPAPSQIFSLSGKIKEVNSNVIILEGVAVSPNPFAGDFPEVRQVAITSDTKIISVSQKDPVVFQAEMMAYQKNGITDVRVAPLPSLYTENQISISEIKAGDIVSVTAANDILSAPSFTAIRIQLTQ